MTRQHPTDAERIALIREAREASSDGWRDIVALWSIENDLDWLLANAERFLAATPAPLEVPLTVVQNDPPPRNQGADPFDHATDCRVWQGGSCNCRGRTPKDFSTQIYKENRGE